MPRHVSASPSCIRCRLRQPACVCAHAPRLSVATRVVIVMHRIEWVKPSNTGHFAKLALRDAEIRLHGAPDRAVREDDIDPAAALALFPGRGGATLSPQLLESLPRPITLLVPDGNWNQTRHMMARLPMLRKARAVQLESPTLDVRCLRRNIQPGRRSTFEALAQALGMIEGEEVARRLLAFFEQILSSKNDRQ